MQNTQKTLVLGIGFLLIFTIILTGSQFGVSLAQVTQVNDDNLNQTGESEIENTEDVDDDGDGVEDNVETENERQVQVEVQSSQVEIQSELKNGENKDKIEMSVKSEDDGIAVQVQYKSESASQESELQFKVQLRKLIEFVDKNGDGMYTPASEPADEKIQEYALKSFKPIEYTAPVDAANPIHYFKIQTIDGVFTAHFYISGEFSSVNETIITPSQLKIDLEIKNFPYQSNDSQLALYTRLESENDYQEEATTENEADNIGSGEDSVETTVNNQVGYFSWAETALIDGVEKPVKTSPVATDDEMESENKIFLNYPRGNLIYHDPTLGVYGVVKVPTSTDPGILDITAPSNYPLYGIVAVALVVGILVIVRIRKKQM